MDLAALLALSQQEMMAALQEALKTQSHVIHRQSTLQSLLEQESMNAWSLVAFFALYARLLNGSNQHAAWRMDRRVLAIRICCLHFGTSSWRTVTRKRCAKSHQSTVRHSLVQTRQLISLHIVSAAFHIVTDICGRQQPVRLRVYMKLTRLIVTV
jgi:hypothetical protein